MPDEDVCPVCSQQNIDGVPGNWNELDKYIDIAIDAMLAEQDLLKYGVNERAVSHRFAYHLENAVTNKGERGWSVDCEYNRAGNNAKRFPRENLIDELRTYKTSLPSCFAGGTEIAKDIEEAIEDLRSTSDRDRPRRIVPDVIIHRRGCDHFNILVVEMKVNTTTKACVLLDWAKLAVFTEPGEQDYPTYPFGLFLEISKSGKGAVQRWHFDKDNRHGLKVG